MAQLAERILIVEDNYVDMRLLKDILESSGYETLQAVDGLQAVYLALTSRPDLILMDLQLPEVSGLEVTRQLRGDDRSRHIPIVAVTAFATVFYRNEALDSGCDRLYLETNLDARVLEHRRSVRIADFPLAPYSFALSGPSSTMPIVVRLCAPHGIHLGFNTARRCCRRLVKPRRGRSVVL
jgi:two-component system cell cycle response regulator DivK